MNNKYNKVPPTLLCPLLICKYQWSASADLCAEYNTVASVTKDRLWAEICYPDHWNKSLSRVYHLRHGLMTRALCDCGFMLFMPSVQPANSTPNRKQESSEQASSCFSLQLPRVLESAFPSIVYEHVVLFWQLEVYRVVISTKRCCCCCTEMLFDYLPACLFEWVIPLIDVCFSIYPLVLVTEFTEYAFSQ